MEFDRRLGVGGSDLVGFCVLGLWKGKGGVMKKTGWSGDSRVHEVMSFFLL